MAPTAGESEHAVEPDVGPGSDPDAELLGRIAAREREAFELLYRRYARPVFGLALRGLRDRRRAEDATREAFAAIWRSAGNFVPGQGVGARWLFTVARDAIVDHEHGAASRGPGAEPAADDGWPTFRVHAAVAELPEPERVPIELAYWGGRSQAEIAELLELPLGTVEIRTRSGLARLAVRLEELG